MTLEALVKDMEIGNTDLIVEIHRMFLSSLIVFAKRYNCTEDDAKDAIDEALLEILKIFIEYNFDSTTINKEKIKVSWKAYIYTIAKNKLLDTVKKRINKPSLADLNADQSKSFLSYLANQVDEDKFQEDLLGVNNVVRKVINTLPEICKNYFNLTLQGLTNKEIALKLGIAKDTPRQQFGRCKEPLINALLLSPYLNDLLIHFPFLTKYLRRFLKHN